MIKNFSFNESFDDLINKVVDSWQPPINKFLEKLYANVWLPSHDIEHHKRVWQNAVTICRQLHLKDTLSSEFYTELLVCCYFHDTGLVYDSSEKHGIESRRIAEEFLFAHNSSIHLNSELLLNAIEKHDDKNYHLQVKKNDLLLNILSLADDIDALGATGLYRYVEIYLLRGYKSNLIPTSILSNVAGRYDNLEKRLQELELSAEEYMQKYIDLVNLIDEKLFPESSESLVKWIDNEIVKKKKSPNSIISEISEFQSGNKRIEAFIRRYLVENNL
jgi:HD superfamily phosphodiesterase